jgi:hypothetical protein
MESKLGQAAPYNHRFAIWFFGNSTCARRADPPRARTPASSPAALFGLLLPQPFAFGLGQIPISAVGVVVIVVAGIGRLRGEMEGREEKGISPIIDDVNQSAAAGLSGRPIGKRELPTCAGVGREGRQ